MGKLESTSTFSIHRHISNIIWMKETEESMSDKPVFLSRNSSTGQILLCPVALWDTGSQRDGRQRWTRAAQDGRCGGFQSTGVKKKKKNRKRDEQPCVGTPEIVWPSHILWKYEIQRNDFSLPWAIGVLKILSYSSTLHPRRGTKSMLHRQVHKSN